MDLVRIPIRGEGILPAVLYAFYLPYCTGWLNGNQVDPRQILESFREELIQRLDRPVDLLDAESPTYYETLGSPYTLEEIQASLRNNGGQESRGYIGAYINRDIYILNSVIRTPTSDITGTRISCILSYNQGHYDLMGLPSLSGMIKEFAPDSPTILNLQSI